MKRLSIALAPVAALFFGLFGCTVEQEAPEIKVESISIDQEDLTLTEGESVTLTATVLPENAVDQSIKWSSSDESVVMVSSGGKILALAVGTVQVIAESGGKTDFIKITVKKNKERKKILSSLLQGMLLSDMLIGGYIHISEQLSLDTPICRWNWETLLSGFSIQRQRPCP